jgi:hypothetical protein
MYKTKLGALLFFMLSAPALAAQHTLVANDYDLIYDDTTTGLFGSPTLVGNTILFTPNDFKAQSFNAGLNVESSTASGLYLVAKNGFKFGSLSLTEFGDYFIDGTGQVSVLGQLRAFDASVGANPILTQTSSNLVVSATTPLNNNDGANHDWFAEASIVNTSNTVIPGHAGWLANATKVGFTVENILKAYSSGSGLQSAFIEKKFAGVGLVITSAVPEPGAWSSFSAGLLILGFMALRRKI